MREVRHVGRDEPFNGLFTQGMVCTRPIARPTATGLPPEEIEAMAGATRSTSTPASRSRSAASRRCRNRRRTSSIPTRSSRLRRRHRALVHAVRLAARTRPEWTEEGAQSAGRFVQRIWRLVNDIAAAAPYRPARTRMRKKASSCAGRPIAPSRRLRAISSASLSIAVSRISTPSPTI